MPDRIILNQQNDIYNYFGDLKINLTKPQEKHLVSLTSGIIGCSDKRTVSNIVRTMPHQGDRSCSTKFLNDSPWNEAYVNWKRKQYAKDRLGFDHYQMRSLKAIKRFWLLQYLAYNYIEFYRYRYCKIYCFGNLGEAIDHIKASNFKTIIDYVYQCGKDKVDITAVYKALKLAV